MEGIVVRRGARVFVSFQRRQEEQARKLVGFLEAAGHTCWHMTRDIRSGCGTSLPRKRSHCRNAC